MTQIASLSAGSESILTALKDYMDWDGISGTPPRTVTVNHKLEGPLYYWIDNYTDTDFPIVVLELNRWPGIENRHIRQHTLMFDATCYVLYKASSGENPHQKARQLSMDVMENIMESNLLGGLVSDIYCTGISTPAGDMRDYLSQYAPGVGIASFKVMMKAVWEVDM